jgi:glycosyltransferase involved in cell wall biosynthesis
MSTAKPINVLYLIDSLTHGGTERQLVELIRHLDPQHVRPHLCTLKSSDGLFDELPVPKQCFQFSSFAKPSLFGVMQRLIRYIRHHNIHIVQTFFQDPCLLAALVKPFTGVKLIGSFRDLGFWRTPVESRKMKWAFPLFDGFIANSQAVKSHFCHMDGLAPERVTVIYNGFDFSSLPAGISKTATPNQAPVVGIVANLNRPVKRVQDFIAAAALIYRQRPDVRFMVIGGGHLKSDLQQQAAELGIAANITFTGMVPDPLTYISGFDVGVVTSETEGFCNAIIEYMASGLPVVATRVGGNVEMVQEGVNGFLYDVGKIDELAAMVLHLFDHPAERPRIMAENRATASKRYSMEAMVTQTTACYQEVLGLGEIP